MRRPVTAALRLRRRLRATLAARRTRRTPETAGAQPLVVHIVADLDEIDDAPLAAALAWRRRSEARLLS